MSIEKIEGESGLYEVYIEKLEEFGFKKMEENYKGHKYIWVRKFDYQENYKTSYMI